MSQRKQPLDFSVLTGSVREALYGGSDLSVSGPPYLRDGVNIQRFLAMPLVAVAPALVAAVYLFGLHVLAVMVTAWLAGGAVELLFALVRRRQPAGGLLVIVVLFSLLLPPGLPLWVVAIGAAAAVFSRELFGGLGHYLFNPILVGKATLLLLFPVLMTAHWLEPFWGGLGGFGAWAPESAVAVTPLAVSLQGGESPHSVGQLMIGNVPGALGATSGLLMLLAGLWMLFTRAVNWRVSMGIVLTVGIGQALLEMFFPAIFHGGPLLHILSGSLLFTAFLIASDAVTSPMTLNGKLLYGLLIGILVLVLRALAGDIEGVTFSVLIANAFVPMLDRVTAPRSYGGAA